MLAKIGSTQNGHVRKKKRLKTVDRDLPKSKHLMEYEGELFQAYPLPFKKMKTGKSAGPVQVTEFWWRGKTDEWALAAIGSEVPTKKMRKKTR